MHDKNVNQKIANGLRVIRALWAFDIHVKSTRKIQFFLVAIALCMGLTHNVHASHLLPNANQVGDNIGIGNDSPNELLTVNGNISLENQSSAPTNTEGFGKIFVNGNILYYVDNGDNITALTGSESGQWVDTGTIVHPTESTSDEVAIGGTTEAGADIFLGVDGAAVFNEQGNAVDFRVEGDTETDAFFVDASSNNVGIGTNSPAAKLDVQPGARNTHGIYMQDTDGSAAASLYLTTAGEGALRLYDSASAKKIEFTATSGSDNFINNSGNFSIGKTSPSERLEVNGSVAIAASGASYKIGSDQVLYANGNSNFVTLVGVGAGANMNGTTLRNTAVGYNTLSASGTTGDDNTALGYNTLAANTTGIRNMAIGGYTLDANTTGSTNTALGYAALTGNTTASNNTAIGASSLFYATTGGSNVAIGSNSMSGANIGNAVYNTALGMGSLQTINGGDYNTTVGYTAGDNITTGSYNIILGANIDAASATGSNQLNIGDTITGDLSGNTIAIGYNTNSPDARLEVGNGTASSIDGTDDLLVADDVEINGDLWIDGTLHGAHINGTSLEFGMGAGAVAFANGGSHITGDATNFFWDDTNDRLGIGTNTPDGLLDIEINAAAENGLVVKANSTQTSNLTEWYNNGGNLRAKVTEAGEFSNSLGITGVEAFGDGISVNTSGTNQVVIGSGASSTLAAAANNVIIGRSASTSSKHNVVIGDNASLTGEGSVAIGSGISVTSSSAVVIGRSASGVTSIGNSASSASGAVAVGQSANANTNDSVAVGANSTAFRNSVALGYNATANAGGEQGSIAIGRDSTNATYRSTAIGRGATNTANYEFVAGSSTSNQQRTDVYFGTGVVAGSPADYTIHGSGGSGTDINGASLTIAGGKATGAGTAGNITFSTANGGAAGTTLRDLHERMRIDGESGNLGINNLSPNEKLTLNGSLSLSNLSSAPSNTQGFGKIFINGNELYYIDNGDNITKLSGSSAGDADTLDTLDSTQFLRSDSSDNFTSGTLTLDAGTTFDINSTAVSIADTDISFDGASTTLTQTTGAFTIAPAAGSNLNISLSGTGDMAVNADTLYVDSSARNVGIGTSSPAEMLQVEGSMRIAASGASYKIGSDQVLYANGNENFLTAVGVSAGANMNGTTIGNTAIGYQALDASGQTGDYNTAVGYQTLTANTTGSSNVAINYQALRNNTTGDYNHAIGVQALMSNTTGDSNIAIGRDAALSNTTGSQNIAIGHQTFYNNTIGYGNTSMGHQALRDNNGGLYNVAFSYQALYRNTEGDNNHAVGTQALYNNTTGNNNIAIGRDAMYYPVTGSSNVTLGYRAGYGVSTQSYSNNTYIGHQAGLATTTGSNNTTLGYQAGDNITNGDANIVIGYATDAVSATADNQLNIGGTIYGNTSTDEIGIGFATANPDATLEVGNGTIGNSGIDGVNDLLVADDVEINGDLWIDGTLHGAHINGSNLEFGVTAGSVLFGNGGEHIVEDNTNFFWDDTNDELGIGTNSPGAKLEIETDLVSAVGQIIQAKNGQTADLSQWQNGGGTVMNVVDSAGNLGIGTSNPSVDLQVGSIGTGASYPDRSVVLAGYSSNKIEFNHHNGWTRNNIASTLNSGFSFNADGSNTTTMTVVINDDPLLRLNNPSSTRGIHMSPGSSSTGTYLVNNADYNGLNIRTAYGVGTYSTFNLDGDATVGSFGSTSNIDLRFKTNGTNRMSIDNNGNVGINNISPNEILTVNGSFSLSNLSSAPSNTQGFGKLFVNGNELYFVDNGDTITKLSGSSAGDADTLDTLDSTQFLRSDTSDSFTTGTLTMDAGTTIDINSTTLQIADTDITLDGASTTFTQTTGDLTLYPANGSDLNVTLDGTSDFVVDTNKLVVDNNGNVGIGSATPAYKLNVYDSSNDKVARFTGPSSHGASDGLVNIEVAQNSGIRWLDFTRTAGASFTRDFYSGSTSKDLQFRLDGTNQFTISENGDINLADGSLSFGKLAGGTRSIIVNPSTGNQVPANLLFKAADAWASATASYDDGGDVYIHGGLGSGSGTNGDTILAHNSSTRVGNVGIADSSPAALLDVGGGTASSIDGTDDLLVKDDVEINGDLWIDGTLHGAHINGTSMEFGMGAGAVAFANGGSHITGDAANFFWDSNNGELGIGTSTPGAKLEIETDLVSAKGLIVQAKNGQTANIAEFQNGGGTVAAHITEKGEFSNNGLGSGSDNELFGDGAGDALTTANNNVAVGTNALNQSTVGSWNVAIGMNSMFSSSTTTGQRYNVAVGFGSLYYNDGGEQNVAIGREAGYRNTSSDYNVFLGAETNKGVSTGSTGARNIFLGYRAGYDETGDNTLVIDNRDRGSEANGKTMSLIYGIMNGSIANQKLTFNANTGISNLSPNEKLTVNGNLSLANQSSAPSNTEGFGKIFVNGNILYFVDNGDNITALTGTGAGQWTDTGTIIHPNEETADEVAIGGTSEAGADIFLGADGTAVFNEQGNSVDFRVEGASEANLIFADASTDRVGIGTSSPSTRFEVYTTGDTTLSAESNGTGWVGFKSRAATNPNILYWDSDSAMRFGTTTANDGDTGWNELARIDNAGKMGLNDTSPDAMLDIVIDATSEQGLIVQGIASQSANLTEWHNGSGALAAKITEAGEFSYSGRGSGSSNEFFGDGAGAAMTTGNHNTAMGNAALDANTDGIRNVAMGFAALGANTGGDNNIGIGYASLTANVSGNNNVAIGSNTLDASTSSNNTAVGHVALSANVSGANNTGFGYYALALSNGDNNIALGYGAGDNITEGSNNLIIGYGMDALSATGSNQLIIGGTIYGNTSTDEIGIGFATANPDATLEVGNGTASSIDGTNDLLVADDVEINGDLWIDGTLHGAHINGTSMEFGMGAGAVAFANGGSHITGDAANFFWDSNNGELGISTNTPGAKLEIETDLVSAKGLIVQAKNGQTANLAEIQNGGGTVLTKIDSDGAITTTIDDSIAFLVETSGGTDVLRVDTSNQDVIASTSLYIGGTSSGPHLLNNEIRGASTNSSFLDIRGGGNTGDGGRIILYGPSHSSNGDVLINAGSSSDETDIALNTQGDNVNFRVVADDGADAIHLDGSTANLGIGQVVSNEKLTVNGNLSLANQSSAPSNTEGFGKLFINGNNLYFIDNGDNITALSGSGAGDVTSSSTITDHAIVRGDGGSKGIQQSAVIIDDSDNITGVTSLAIDGTGTSALIVDTNVLAVDATNDRVGIGLASSMNGTLHVVSGATTEKALVVQGVASQATNLTEWQNGGGTIFARVNSSGEFSNPLTYTVDANAPEVFGAGATVTGNRSMAVGNSASANAYATALGSNANASGNSAIGVGRGSNATGAAAIAIGVSADATQTGSISIGYDANSTAANTFVSGGSTYPINDVHFGKGITHATPTNYTIHGTGGSGTDIDGANITIAGGKATGAGTAGNIIFSTANGGAAGTTLRDLHERMRIAGESGNIGINNLSPNEKLTLNGSLSLVEGSAPSNTSGFGKIYVASGNSKLYFLDDGGTAYNLTNGSGASASTINDLTDGVSDGNSSVFLGNGSGLNDDGSDNKNVGLGYNALNAVTTGYNNTAIGNTALESLSTAYHNTAVGYASLQAVTTAGHYNTAIGSLALNDVTSGDRNLGIGYKAAEGFDSRSDNIAIGYLTMSGASQVSDDNIAIGNWSLDALTSGYNNIGLGHYALSTASTGYSNIAIGYETMDAETTGDNNIAIGQTALGTSSTSNNNIAIGRESLRVQTAADDNVSVGYRSGYRITTGSDNVAVGSDSMYYNQTGSFNSIIGREAARGTTTSSYSNGAFLGYRAGYAITSGDNNTAIGYQAGDSITTGANNIFLGYNAGQNVSTGSSNIIIGSSNDAGSATGSNQLDIGDTIYADMSTDNVSIGTTNNYGILTLEGSLVLDELASAPANTSGYGKIYVKSSDSNLYFKDDGGTETQLNAAGGASDIDGLSDGKSGGTDEVFLGSGAGATESGTTRATGVGIDALTAMASSGTDNTAFGYHAGDSITTGDNNTAIGSNALQAASGAVDNTAIGYNALSAQTFGDNVAIGSEAMPSDTASSRTVAIGYRAFYSSANNSNDSVAIGNRALYSGSGAEGNVAIGSSALYSNTSADLNTAVGASAAYSNTTAFYNTALGYTSLYYNQTGAHNTALGYRAGFGASGQSHDYSTFVGSQAGEAITTGDYNTMVGFEAGDLVTSGTNNVLLGDRSGDNITTGDSNIIIGSNNDAASATADNQLDIGDTIYADMSTDNVSIGTTNNYAILTLEGGLALDEITAPANSSGYGKLYVKSSDSNLYFKDDGGTETQLSGAGGGVSAINDLTDGVADSDATYLGSGAGAADTGTNYNTGVGVDALAAADADTLNNVAIGYHAADSLNSGDDNIAIGYNSLQAATSGSKNVAVGYGSLDSLTTASDNLAIGYNALTAISSSGKKNIALGNYAGDSITGGDYNIAIGQHALAGNANGNKNIAIGNGSLHLLNGVSDNIGIGYDTLAAITSGGANNLAIGNDAGKLISSGDQNVVIGHAAGDNITTGSTSIIIGYNNNAPSATEDDQLDIGDTIYGDMNTDQVSIGTTNNYATLTLEGGLALDQLSSAPAATSGYGKIFDNGGTLYYRNGSGAITDLLGGGGGGASDINGLTDGVADSDSTYLGSGAGAADTGTIYNTGVGVNALAAADADTQRNVAIGNNAGDALNSGDDNVAIGYDAMTGFTSASDSVAVGSYAFGTATSGPSSVAVGYYALGGVSSVNNSVAIGYQAMKDASGADNSIGIGYNALDQGSGDDNIAIGYAAFDNSTNIQRSIAIGTNAMGSGTTGSYNIAMGYNASLRNETGTYNTALGYEAGLGASSQSYSYNTFVGAQAGKANSTATYNTMLGYQAGDTVTTGGYNVLLGALAGDNIVAGTHNIIIGASNSALSGANSYQLDIGDTIYADMSNDQVSIGTTNNYGILTLEGALALDQLSSAPAATSGYGKIFDNGGTLYYRNGSGAITDLLGGGGGSSEWTENSGALHPADSSGEQDVLIGGTTAGAADIILDNGGSAVFNEQAKAKDFRIEGDTADYLFFLDGSADNIGIGTVSPASRLEINGTLMFTSEYNNGNSGASKTIDWGSYGNRQYITLNNNTTLTLDAPGVGNFLIRLVQDGTGSRTVTWAAASGSVKWPSGTAPTLSTTASAEDIVTCYYNGTNYYCQSTLDFQ